MSSESEKKTRGQRGQRPIFFVCAVMKGEELVHETVQSTTREGAIEAFKAKFGKKNPLLVEGPFYKVIGNTPMAQRKTVLVDSPQFTNKKYHGVYEGWNVEAQGLQATGSYKDNELVFLFMGKDPAEEGASKPKFGPSKPIVELSAIQVVKSV